MARIVPIQKLTLKEMMFHMEQYRGLPNDLAALPVPSEIRIKKKLYQVPQNMDEFTKNICYGQRMFLTTKEENDFGIIIRVIDGYYYPLVTKQKWNADNALLFGKIVLTCMVLELYPVAMHIVKLIGEMAEREQKLLHREPSKMELAAGIEKLNVFSELNALDFLRDAMKITVAEVLQTPYNECLVRFMNAKENVEYQERYYELMKADKKTKYE